MIAQYTPELHARLRELHRQASPAPWAIEPHPDAEMWGEKYGIAEFIKTPAGDIEQAGCGCCDRGIQAPKRGDIELITENRNALEALLDHIEWLTVKLQDAQHEGWVNGYTEAAHTYYEGQSEPSDFTQEAKNHSPYQENQ